MKVAIYARQVNEKILPSLITLLQKLNEVTTDIFIFGTVYTALKNNKELLKNTTTFSTASEIKDNINFMFSLGGDGTILDTISLVQNSQIQSLTMSSL